MSLSDRFSPAPREVRLAGAITALPGLALLVMGVLLAVDGGSMTGTNIYGEVAYYVVFAAFVLAAAAGLLLGKTWARSPAVVVSLLLIGIGWYATGPSSEPGLGMPILLAGVAVIVLLFRRASRAWALGQREGESEEDAARRGGAEGRAAERERDEPG